MALFTTTKNLLKACAPNHPVMEREQGPDWKNRGRGIQQLTLPGWWQGDGMSQTEQCAWAMRFSPLPCLASVHHNPCTHCQIKRGERWEKGYQAVPMKLTCSATPQSWYKLWDLKFVAVVAINVAALLCTVLQLEHETVPGRQLLFRWFISVQIITQIMEQLTQLLFLLYCDAKRTCCAWQH